MKRTLMNQLQAWKTSPHRKPLILKGVRQTGKTYLLEAFGREQFSNTHRINFEKQLAAVNLFEQDLEPKRILEALSFMLNQPINLKTDLVIFDEIQACPKALTSLKYFCEELPELALCSAGSLLGLHLSEGSYPVGKVDMLHLYPLTFFEFLEGIGDHMAAEAFLNMNAISTPPALVHERLWQRLKHYFITGGLPEVVKVFANEQESLFTATEAVRKKQEQLIDAYTADIAKHSGKVNAMHIERTWRDVPLQLSSAQEASTNRFKFKGIIPNLNRYAQFVSVIDWLFAAELILKLPIVETVQQPLKAYTKENFFKLLMFDVGILGAVAGLSPKLILDYDYGTYKGYFAENFVAQQLIATGHNDIVCWQEDRSEVEFLLPLYDQITPVEVKSGSITRAKSLQKYHEKYNPQKSVVLSARPPYHDSANQRYHLPLYLAEQLGTHLFKIYHSD